MIAKGLTSIGLILEFASVYILIRHNLYLTYKKELAEIGKYSTSERERKNKIKSQCSIILLAVGMLLQGIALIF